MDRPNKNGASALRAVHMGLYPTLDTLDSAVDLAMSQVPVMNKNEMYAILMVYHNTMLKVMGKEHVSAID